MSKRISVAKSDRLLPRRPRGLPDSGDRFSGHSLRVGIAQDLGSAGVGLLAIQNAGHWKSPRMSACYRRKLLPTRFAVAWLPED